MALKAKIANKIELDDEGFVTGTIVAVIDCDEKTVIEKGKEVTYAEQFEFQIESLGSIKPITYRIWTSQKVNNDKFEIEEGVTDYNKLTRLLIQLQKIDEKTLVKNLKEINVDVESVEGTKIKFKLEKSKKTRGLSVPNLRSIKLVEDNPSSTAKAK